MNPPGHGRIAIRIALFAIAFRLLSAALACLAVIAFPLDQRAQATMFGQPSPFWDPFTRYDSGWYYQIARSGYHFVVGGPSVGVGKPGKIAYFPVYPLLMRAAGRLFGHGAGALYLGGILVAWTSFVVAMIVLFHLARLDLPRRHAECAVLLTAVFPFAFFFGMVYTEATFLLFTLLSVYGFRTRRWWLGGLAGAAATATRVNGILMLPALAWIAWRAAAPVMQDRLRAAAALVVATCGLGAYCVFVYRLSGNPFEWASSIERWGYHPGGPVWAGFGHLLSAWTSHPYLYLTTDRMALYDTLYGATALAFVAATPLVWYRFGAGYGLFLLLNLLLPLSSGVFEGLGRYCSVLFPCFIWLGSIRSRAVAASVLVVFALFYTLALALFATLHPLF
jgi:hypothetical protein